MQNKLYKMATVMAIVGLSVLGIVLFMGAAYPDNVFRIGAPIGLLFLFLSLLLYTIDFAHQFVDAVRNKQYMIALLFLFWDFTL